VKIRREGYPSLTLTTKRAVGEVYLLRLPAARLAPRAMEIGSAGLHSLPYEKSFIRRNLRDRYIRVGNHCVGEQCWRLGAFLAWRVK
jgi:hypothetical protein